MSRAPDIEKLGYDAVAIDAALASDLSLPARWYFDPAVYELELELIFDHAWQLAGPVERVKSAGDVFLCDVGHVPVVVTRDLGGDLHAFVNVCRHRLYPVATEDGHRSVLQCRYHAWTYELDGRLRRAPRSEREAVFDENALGLVPVAVDTWGEFVWVNPDRTAPPLRGAHPGLDRVAADVDFGGYEYVRQERQTLPVNWKAWVDNGRECYHCPAIHKTSFSEAWDVRADSFRIVNDGRVFGQFATPNRNARRFAHATSPYSDVYVFPASFLVLDEFVGFAGFVVPRGPEVCDFVSHFYVRPGVHTDVLVDWMQMYAQTMAEDIAALERQQRGLHAGAVPHGRIMRESESAIAHFHHVLWEALRPGLGSAGTGPIPDGSM